MAGFHAAKGIITSAGGKASHAALVARGMGKPCVSGAAALEIDLNAKRVKVGDTELSEGDLIALDGTAGLITLEDVPLEMPELSGNFETVLAWSDEIRKLGVRANADIPDDARKSRQFGAEGVGLCRTEHMFMAADRQPKMRTMIMARTAEERRAALDALLPLQQQDFEGIFEEMAGLPVTIRLLDPPLHEFMPDLEQMAQEVERARIEHDADLDALQHTLDRIHQLDEANPMLGTRGVRLGILYPEIYEMQVRAIIRAALAVRERSGEAPGLEIMIPLVAYEGEFELMRGMVERWVAEEQGSHDALPLKIGTMIELPRACLVADRIAHTADFFSFGTNDLTQTTLGFSRDDVEASFLPRYIDHKIVDRSPFETIDDMGVGRLVYRAVQNGRDVKENLELGICGEHGGDPDSIIFFHHAGLDYVSCSPYRVPIARVAAAQAALGAGSSALLLFK